MMQKTPLYKRSKEAGNAIAMVFMAIGMAGVVTYGLNNIIRGPAVTAAETGRRTIVENNLVATTRLAIAASARQQANDGDCDQDGFVEPLPFRAAGGAPAPTSGGLLPMTLGASMTDAWGTQYGYCVWDQGTVRKSDAFAGCGGAGANRLEGAPRDDQPAIAVISAGNNGAFETTCNDYVDTTPADGKPDTALVVEAGGSDDVVLSYTYAEANGIGGGLWKISQDVAKPNTAEISRNIRSTSEGGASFGEAVELQNRGLVLPGDNGTDNVTGPCDTEVKDGQLRRNTSTSPPTIEMCDFTNGAGWIPVSGGTIVESRAFNPNIGNCTANQGGPLSEITRYNLPFATSIWSGTGRPTQLLFATSSVDDRVNALTFNGTTFQEIWGATGLNVDYNGVWADENYAYTISDNALKAWQWDGTKLIERHSIASAGVDVWADAGKVFVSGAADPIRAYTFNGTTLTAAGSAPPKTSATHIWGRGSNIFVADVGGSVALSHSGSTLTEVAVASSDMTVTGDANYIYIAGPNGIKAYTFSGTALTEVGDLYYADLARLDLWTDGANIFALNEATLTVLAFDGTTFSVVDQIVLSGAGPHYHGTIWGDGNYIYVAATSGLYALSGYGCTSHNPPGGPGSVTIEPSPNAAMPDSLDAGLVSHWKMDEASGNVIIDSVGENNGTLVDDATRTKGQVGGGVTFSTYDPDGTITIPGQMDDPQEGTIAGWVNVVSDRDSSIFSIGDYVILGYSVADGLFLKFWDNSTFRFTNSKKMIGNDGWHYVAATFDSPNDMFRVYVDGIMVGEQTFTQNIAWGPATVTLFGKKGMANSLDNLTGSVDDFRYYNRPLSSAEITELSRRAHAEASSGNLAQTASAQKFGAGMVSAGDNFSCAIDQDGGAWCWGRDNMEQLGNGVGATQQNAPVQVKEPTEQTYHLYNILADINYAGSPSASWLPWMQPGTNPNGPWNPGETFYGQAITAAGYPGTYSGPKPYTLVLNQAVAQPCISLTITLTRLNSSGAIQSSAQLGQPTLLTSTTGEIKGTVDLGAFSQTDRLAIRAQWTNTCGSVVPQYLFSAQLKTPRMSYPSWTSISSGTTHTCGLKSDATAWCWGSDLDTQLGNSSASTANFAEPMQVTGSLNATWGSLDAGFVNVCGIGLNGGLYCWGNNTYGQVGDGTTGTAREEPVRVGTDSDWSRVSVAGTGHHVCAIKNNGRMYCWGRDHRGQLGNGSGSSANQTTPLEISDLGPWAQVTTGTEHTCGIKTDGSVWCWGGNTSREVDTSGTIRHSPVLIPSPGAWVDIAAGSFNTCGVKTDSRVYCWGLGTNGDLGNGGTSNTFPPTAVHGLDNVASVTGGMQHNCAVRTNGSVFCWGRNNDGQLGTGSVSVMSTTPVQARGMPGAPNWWSYADASNIIMAPYGFNTALLGGTFHNAGAESFGFTAAGRAALRRLAGNDNNQLTLESTASGYSTQASFSATSPATTADVTTGLVGRWSLDTNSTANVGAGVNGTDNNGIAYDTRGRVGGAAIFAGANNFIDIPRSASVMEHSQTTTISFWMKRVGTQNSTIINKTYANGATAPFSSWQFVMQTNQRLGFATGHTTDSNVSTLSTTSIPDNAWVHVVGVYNATGAVPQKKLFINGVLNASSTISANLKYDTNATTGKMYIGKGCTSCPQPSFKGALDDVRIYNRALSDAEVTQLYNYQAMQGQIAYSMGIDHVTNNLEVGRNIASGANLLSGIVPDLAITATGNVGIGVAAPVTKLDVAGGMRLGNEPTCDTNRAGTMRFTGEIPPYEYCNGTAWQSFGVGNMANAWRKNTKNITLGYNHTCGIKSNGGAWCWGNASAGSPLGDNQSATDRIVPVRVHDNSSASGWNDWLMISADQNTISGEKTCGIRSNRSLWCWGTNTALGQNNTAQTSLRPVLVQQSGSPLAWYDWTDVSVGGNQVCGLRSDGTAWCWGINTYGELGNNTVGGSQGRPVQVSDSAGTGNWTDWIKISAGYQHTCGLRSNGTAWCWGAATNGRLGDNQNSTNRGRPVQVLNSAAGAGWTDWLEISAGQDFTCGVRSDGTAWCWGFGQTGKLGINATPASQNVPAQIRDSAGTGFWTNWSIIATGAGHTCGLRNDGSAWCWGESGQNQLGDNQNATDRLLPVRVHDSASSTGWSDWVSIEAANTHTCGVRTNGTMWCWGEIWGGKLGVNRNNTPHGVRPEAVQ